MGKRSRSRERDRRDLGETEVTVTLTIDEAIAISGVMELASSLYVVIAGEEIQDAINTGAAKVRDSYTPLLQEFMRSHGTAEEAFGEEPAGKERE